MSMKIDTVTMNDISEYEEFDYDANDDIESNETNSDNDVNEVNGDKIHLDISKYANIAGDVTDFCDHKNIIKQNNCKEVCSDCGIEVYQQLSLAPEWRYYGENDSRHSSDPNRCVIRKVEDKGIYKDVDSLNLSSEIVEEANQLYTNIFSKGIHRGKSRKSVIFACVFQACKYNKIPILPDQLQKMFKMSKKDVSTGLKYFQLQVQDKPEIKNRSISCISPVEFIPFIMKRFNASQDHISNVKELYYMIQNKSSLINRSNPQSVISGLVFYYCRLIGKNITCAKFSEIVKLSDITVSKIDRKSVV